MGDVESSPDQSGRSGGRSGGSPSPSPEKKIVIIESEAADEKNQVVEDNSNTNQSQGFELNVRRSSAALSELGSSFELMDPTDALLLDPGSSPPPGGGMTTSEEECGYEDEMEDSMIQFPDMPKSMLSSCSGLPPRTIPFRSASFSQVDITSEGKYVRNPRSPITLKPTAFCLLNKGGGVINQQPQQNSGAATLPRTGPGVRCDAFGNPLEVKSCPSGEFCQLSEEQGNGSETPTLISLTDSRNSIVTVNEMKELEFPYCDFNQVPLGDSGSDSALLPEPSSGEIEDPDVYQDADPGEPDDTTCQQQQRVNFTLGGDEESLDIIRNTVIPPDSGDFSATKKIEEEVAVKKEDDPDVDIPTEAVVIDSSPQTQSSGAGSTSSTSAESDAEKGQFIRQSSGQSDGSDEIPPLNMADPSCSSPLPPGGGNSNTPAPIPVPHITSLAELRYSSMSPPPLANKKEMTRAHSVSTTTRSLPRGRYNKRPLRGPYGEMLEAEMNKLIPVRTTNQDFDHFEIFRESKSSSPNRSSNSHSNSPESSIPPSGASGNINVVENNNGSGISAKKLTSLNPILMASMDDLNLTKGLKHSNSNPRSRKISANLPVSTSHYSDDKTSPLVFHQRTSSSPSQLLYTSPSTTTSAPSNLGETKPIARLLDGSPRGHVLAEIVETEKSYVDSLQIITKKYMEPLKCSDLIDGGLVDEIFSQIPTIMWHHERLLGALQKRVVDDNQCVGDVLLDAFRQTSLLECYSLFVNNWKNAKGSLKMAVASKPALARFLEANARQHKGKLNLDSLLIMPIQRIPRYELMVKELLKYTEAVHEDHSRLMLLLEKIRKFAIHIDCASVDPNDNREVEIEGWTSGLGHLVRQDMVGATLNNSNRKEKALFLFADSLVLAAIKRKGTRKPSSNLGSATGSQWDGCKFKLIFKCQLTDIHLPHDEFELTALIGVNAAGGGAGAAGRSGDSQQQLQQRSLPHGASYSSSTSSGSHEDMDDLKIVHRMMDLAASLKCAHLSLDEALRELVAALRTHHHADNHGDPLELEIKTNDSDCSEVLKLYFSSADKRNGWLDSFQDTLGKFVRYGFGKLPTVQFIQALPIRKTRAGLQLSCAAPVSLQNKVSKTLEMSDVWVANSDGYVGQICILTLHPEPAITSCNGVCNSRITCIISVPPPPPPMEDHHPPHHHHAANFHTMGYESEDETHKLRAGHKNTEHWTVWLGTEDGGLHVYDCSDSVRVKKNRHKIQHSSPMVCIVYYDNRVFASLANGDVAVYSRNQNAKGWSMSDPSWVTIGSAITPVTKMLCVASTVWCCCGSQVKVYSDTGGMLELLQTVQLTVDGNEMPKGVMALVATDEHVWIAVQGSSVVKCYNFTTFEPVTEINVGPDVIKMLTGCDEIIRQHKTACLRVTSLLIAPDKKLWIGTSAGVILTMSLATIAEPKIIPLSHGHTGQVRFLTCCLNRDSWVVVTGGDGFEEFKPLTPPLNNNSGGSSSSSGGSGNSSNNNNSSSFSSMVTSLMGDSSNDTSGREDSTNHLLIWKIPKPL